VLLGDLLARRVRRRLRGLPGERRPIPEQLPNGIASACVVVDGVARFDCQRPIGLTRSLRRRHAHGGNVFLKPKRFVSRASLLDLDADGRAARDCDLDPPHVLCGLFFCRSPARASRSPNWFERLALLPCLSRIANARGWTGAFGLSVVGRDCKRRRSGAAIGSIIVFPVLRVTGRSSACGKSMLLGRLSHKNSLVLNQ
jgi:hypothetical protein